MTGIGELVESFALSSRQRFELLKLVPVQEFASGVEQLVELYRSRRSAEQYQPSPSESAKTMASIQRQARALVRTLERMPETQEDTLDMGYYAAGNYRAGSARYRDVIRDLRILACSAAEAASSLNFSRGARDRGLEQYFIARLAALYLTHTGKHPATRRGGHFDRVATLALRVAGYRGASQTVAGLIKPAINQMPPM